MPNYETRDDSFHAISWGPGRLELVPHWRDFRPSAILTGAGICRLTSCAARGQKRPLREAGCMPERDREDLILRIARIQELLSQLERTCNESAQNRAAFLELKRELRQAH